MSSKNNQKTKKIDDFLSSQSTLATIHQSLEWIVSVFRTEITLSDASRMCLHHPSKYLEKYFSIFLKIFYVFWSFSVLISLIWASDSAFGADFTFKMCYLRPQTELWNHPPHKSITDQYYKMVSGHILNFF